jgi:hypothetical protein
VYQSSVSLGDFDNDGYADIAMCGNTGSGSMTGVYHSNGNGTFTDINANLPGVKQGTVEFGDFDADGDLDLLVVGHDGANRVGRVFVNTLPVPNLPPSAPTDLIEAVSGTTLLLYGYPGFDDRTSHPTWNYRAGTGPGASDIIAPMSHVNGRRMIPRRGAGNPRTIPLTAFGHGSLYWSAQSVDQTFSGSAWAPERVFTPGPRIVQVADVPGDQGGHVRLTLSKSMLDTESSSYQAVGYNVWRLVTSSALDQTLRREGVLVEPRTAARRLAGSQSDPRQATHAERPTDGADLELIEWSGRLFTRSSGVSIASAFPPGTWEIVGSFYATQQPTYLVASTTAADSGASGSNDATFIVTVHTTTPSVWFASLPGAGHSVDNIAPGAPTGVTAAHHTGSGNQLAWNPAPEPDFESFNIYRGTTPGFVPGPSNLAATVGTSSWTDPAHDSPVVFYRVSTLDHAGNESPAVAPGSTTEVEIDGAPLAFALSASSPNPFGSVTRIGFALPRATEVRLEIFDAGGRLVRILVDGSLPAGRHEASWSGVDDAGRRVEAGMFFYRLRAGSFSASRRMAFVP